MIKCQEVLIKFMDRAAAQQEVRALQVAAATHLEIAVHHDGKWLAVNFVTAKNGLVKQINYNMADIKEYACTSIIWENVQ